MAALVLASASQLALPVAIRYLIDAGLLAESAASIDRYFLGLFLVAVAFSLFSALRFYFVIWLGERVAGRSGPGPQRATEGQARSRLANEAPTKAANSGCGA